MRITSTDEPLKEILCETKAVNSKGEVFKVRNDRLDVYSS